MRAALALTLSSVTAALLVGAAPRAEAQLVCSPATVSAGADLHLTSAGRFGASMPAGLTVAAVNAGGTSTPLAVRSWTASNVTVQLPAGLSPGSYAVLLSTPAGPPQRQAACFTVTPTIVAAPLAPRSVVAGVVLPSLSRAEMNVYPCARDIVIRMTGTGFTPGSGYAAPNHYRLELERAWSSGLTMVETATDATGPDPYFNSFIENVAVTSPTHLEARMSLGCFGENAGARLRIWFPDGTKSAWVRLQAPPIGPGMDITR
jgi:hypothetical protein